MKKTQDKTGMAKEQNAVNQKKGGGSREKKTREKEPRVKGNQA